VTGQELVFAVLIKEAMLRKLAALPDDVAGALGGSFMRKHKVDENDLARGETLESRVHKANVGGKARVVKIPKFFPKHWAESQGKPRQHPAVATEHLKNPLDGMMRHSPGAQHIWRGRKADHLRVLRKMKKKKNPEHYPEFAETHDLHLGKEGPLKGKAIQHQEFLPGGEMSTHQRERLVERAHKNPHLKGWNIDDVVQNPGNARGGKIIDFLPTPSGFKGRMKTIRRAVEAVGVEAGMKPHEAVRRAKKGAAIAAGVGAVGLTASAYAARRLWKALKALKARRAAKALRK